MVAPFSIYYDGSVQIVDERVRQPVSFAHVADLHMAGLDPAAWPAPYRRAIEWWRMELGRPDETFEGLLDEIRAREVDFVFFGGDMMEYYEPATADWIVEQCRRRGLVARFQVGNHDTDTARMRYETHAYEAETYARNLGKLCRHWSMEGPQYVFDLHQVRFVAFTPIFVTVEDGYGGLVDREQADWIVDQLQHPGPLVLFHHIPFALPTVEERLLQHFRGVRICMAEDANGSRVREAIAACPNLLGAFCGHAHLRSEDPNGRSWQFIAPPAFSGAWRYVKIGNEPPPRSLRAPGEPEVGE